MAISQSFIISGPTEREVGIGLRKDKQQVEQEK